MRISLVGWIFACDSCHDVGPCNLQSLFCRFFFFNDTATTEIYTLSLHDALPISRCAGTRISGETFSVDHDTLTGASNPATSRLYELTSGFVTAQYPSAWRSSPPTYQRPVSESCRAPRGSWNALWPCASRVWWVCIPEPFTPWRGLGMKVATRPCCSATLR